MNKELIKTALEESLAIMENEKKEWDDTTTIYDDTIYLCKRALKELEA